MQVKDPRLGMVTITDARLTPDLRDATLYYTVYGDEAARADTAAALESARGVLRTQVGRQTGIKFTPTLAFVADVVPEHAAQIDELLAVAREADAGLAQVREGATYAGDPDPYKHDGNDDGDTDGDPDADAVGSMLALALALRARGTAVLPSFSAPFELAGSLSGLPGVELLVPPDTLPA